MDLLRSDFDPALVLQQKRRIKRELLKILKSKDEVERVFKIIVEQEEY